VSEAASRLAVLFREQHGRLVAVLLREAGIAQLAAVEDALQQAMLAALRRWPFDGVPDHPVAWLLEAARNARVDAHRGARRLETGHDLEEVATPRVEDTDVPAGRFARELDDDELALLFAVCHPQLPPASQVALALRTLGGLGLRELSASLLTTEDALAQRLKRAREQLATLDEPLAVPAPEALPARAEAVRVALYVMFNEGYQSAEGSGYQRRAPCLEAIRLARALAAHPTTGGPAADALAAMLCLHAARLSGRVDADGRPLLLPDQPRERWDRGLVALGLRHLDRAARGGTLTRWHCEAAIAAAHAVAPSFEATDWVAVVDWYERLLALDASPVPRLAHAIAVGQARGPAAGLGALEAVLPLLPRDRFPFGESARGDFLARLGRHEEACAAYARAQAQARSDAERGLIERKLAALRGAG
jgi:RNA polymerase sigma-70 factor (ECF subfamily)